MNKLPPEVLCDIFLDTFAKDYYYDCLPNTEYILRPLHISHVCRRWHRIAISYGPLWSYLRIGWVTFPKREIFDLFLERSNCAPLHFDIQIDHDLMPDQRKYEYAVYMVNTLVAQQHRWCQVNLSWHKKRNAEPDHVPVLNLANMPMLTALRLFCIGKMQATIDLRHSPNLQKLKVACDLNLPEATIKAPPLLRLTSPCWLTFKNVSSTKAALRSCLDFLGMVPVVEQMRIQFHVQDSTQHHLVRSPNRILLPKLRKMEYAGYTESETIFESVTLPSLEVFNLIATLPGKPLVNFFRRSVPPLRILVIKCTGAPEGTIIDVLRLLPTLQEFSLIRTPVTSRFFQELTIGTFGRNTQQVLCPGLAYLCVDRDRERPAEDNAIFVEALISMVESRAQYLNTFSKIYFIGRRGDLDVRILRQLSFRDMKENPPFSVWRDGYLSYDFYGPW